MHRGVNGEDTKPINIGLFRIQIKSRMVQQDMVSYKIMSMFRRYKGEDIHNLVMSAPQNERPGMRALPLGQDKAYRAEPPTPQQSTGVIRSKHYPTKTLR